MEDQDLWIWFGVPEVREKTRQYKYIEPEGAPIEKTAYPKIIEYHQDFFDRYITDHAHQNHTQEFNSRECTWKDENLQPCTFTQKKFRYVNLRIHFMSHFDDSYEKYVCPRCGKNYGKYNRLLEHAENNRCRIASSDYPPHKFFFDESLQFHPEQERESLICSKCNKKFTNTFLARRHFYSCIRYIFPCYKCNGTFHDYGRARIHYESCDGNPKIVNTAYHPYNFQKPTEEDDKTWSDEEIILHIEQVAIPKIEWNLKSYPKGARAYFGQTAVPEQRFKIHRQYQAIFKRQEANPYIEDNDFILCKFWKRSDALRYEFHLQKSTSTPEGKFFARIGHQVNFHHIIEPKEPESDEAKAPVYVYMMVSRRQYQPSKPGDIYDSDEDEEKEFQSVTEAPTDKLPSTSSSTASTPHNSHINQRRIIVVDSDDSD